MMPAMEICQFLSCFSLEGVSESQRGQGFLALTRL
jgi:hypothetical protein